MNNILLIGGSYGIGLEIGQQLSKHNNIFVASRTKEHLPPSITHLPFDVLTDTVLDLELPEVLHGLVYCPGSINLKPFKNFTLETFQKDMDINFLSLVKTVQALLPKLKKAEQASLVFFSTVAVKVGMPFHTSVAAAKGAVEGFAKALAAEYAPNFRVNVIAPSLTNTPLAGNLLNSEAKKEKMGARHPLQRVGTSSDIASLASYLLSDHASWITGQVLAVDGGLSTLNMQ